MTDYQHLLRPRSTNVVQEAGFFRRFFAFIVDILVIDLLIATPFASLFENLTIRAQHNWTSLTYTTAEFTGIVLLFLIMFLYFVLFEYLLGQTIGMTLFHIHIDGETGIIPVMVRNSFLLPVLPAMIFWVIEPFAILLWRRRVLEFVSKTRTMYQRNVLI